jgi:hypothetical protein
MHRLAKVADDWGDPLPECTDDERWMTNDPVRRQKGGQEDRDPGLGLRGGGQGTCREGKRIRGDPQG